MKGETQKEDRRALYLRLYEHLRGEIAAGDYPYGARLPSKRALAAAFGVSVVTVEHTLELLAEEGYIEPRERSGCFVCFSDRAQLGRPERAEPPLLPAEPPRAGEESFPFSVLAGAMRRVISDYGEALLARCPNAGAPELRSAVAAYLRRSRGMDVSEDQIVIGAGAEALYTLTVATLGRGRAYAIETPSYEKIEAVYRAAGVVPERLPLGPHGIRSDALENCAAQVLHVTPYRSYPSGVTASASKRREYLRWAEAPGRLILEDDFESEFTPSTKPMDTLYALTDRENVIYMNTFSRTIAPSVRVGYLVLPRRLLPAFQENTAVYSCSVPAFEQYLIAGLLGSGDFERHLNRVRRAKRNRQKT
jgi:GntR family transcriptional regulator/MocR family aminotransferase